MEHGSQQPGTRGASGPAAGEEKRCAAIAQLAAVAPTDLQRADEGAVKAVRDVIEKRAEFERLDDTMKMQVLALFDKGEAAAREAVQARVIADRYAMAGAQRTERRTGGSAPRRGQAEGAGAPPAR